jgi:hypothetical protein
MNLAPPPGSLASHDLARREAASPKFDAHQLAVINSEAKNLVAEAFAGAGKTTTAIGYANARPEARILYVCFGKKNQIEAQARFGSNVMCRTSHSLAYASVGAKFKNQITMTWRPRDLAAQLQIADLRMAAIVQAALGSFFASTDREVAEGHIRAIQELWSVDHQDMPKALALARFAWQRMSTIGSGVSMPPDGYMKLWALSKPKLTNFSHIILDEAQDTAPVTAEVVMSQTHATRLLIGDRHQSIYLFRGALNAMETFAASGATVLQMPTTYRFGPQIADMANRMLSMFKGESTAIIGKGPSHAAAPNASRAVLSRTNVGLFEEAAEVMGRHTHWVGGIDKYKVDTLVDAWLLKSQRGGEIRDPHMRGYDSWSHFKNEAEQTRDQSSKMLVKLVEKYGDDVPVLVSEFRRNELPTATGAKLVLSTAHNAKGLDFDRVKIGEDFACLDKAYEELLTSPNTRLMPATAQEINLLYVGITRARHKLELNKETATFMDAYPNQVRNLMAAVARKQGIHLPPAAGDETHTPATAPAC